MSARQRRFGWAVAVLAALVTSVAVAYFCVIDTATGRRWLLARIVPVLNGGFHDRGHLRVGTLQEIGWGRVRLDSVSLVDSAGVTVLHVAHASGRLDFRALLDRRVHVVALDVEGVQLDLRKDNTGPWNLSYIISGDTVTTVHGPPGFGDDIRIDTLRLTSGTITTIAPWAPHPIFTGTARDSVIAVRDSLHDLAHTPQGLFERRRVTLDRVVAHRGIITRPDRAPSSMTLDSVRGTVSDPPVRVLAAAGQVRWTSDSLQLDVPTVVLPASRGAVAGRVWWNQPGAVRFDVGMTTQAGLSDLTWIWDVLPTTGRGTATVRMRTLESADDAEYTLSPLDVSSAGSRITGRINVVVHPADIVLNHVDLTFTPLRAELLRRLSYEAVPAFVRGTLQGRLIAETGGPLSRFVVDRLDARFDDAVVPGAVSSLRLHGAVTMGVAPAARTLELSSFDLDLRSVNAMMAALARSTSGSTSGSKSGGASASTAVPPDGRLSGRARLVAADLNAVDARDVALVWTDAAGNVSRLAGEARVGFGLRVPTVHAALAFDPLSMRALARIDTTLPMSSALVGQVRLDGTLDSLAWQTSLATDAVGMLRLEGTAALETAVGRGEPRPWRVSAAGTIDGIDLRAWTARTDVPGTALSGQLAAALTGTRDAAGGLSLDAARGTLALRQAEAADRPAFDATVSAALNDRRLQVDSATIHVGGITLDAHGALARRVAGALVPRDSSGVGDARTGEAPMGEAPMGVDTLEVSARADTLETVRRQLERVAATLAPLDSAAAASLRAFAADTLRGDASVSGYLIGALQDFDATLALGARDVQVGAIRLGRVFGSLRARDVLTRPTFEAVATVDAIDGIGAVRIASTEFRVQRANPDSGQLVLDASSANEAHFIVRGGYRRRDGSTTVTADSLRFQYDSVTWRSSAPIRVLSDADGLHIDSLEIRSSARGRVAAYGAIPRRGAVQGSVQLERFPVGEALAFGLGTRRLSGLLTGDVALAGTRALPVIDWRMLGDSLGVDGNYLPPVASDGHYADRRVVAHASITDSLGGALRGEVRIPLDLAIGPVAQRLLSDAVDADVTADSLQLGALGVTVAGVDRVRGAVAGRVRVTGTVDRPVATGQMALSDFSVLSRALGIEPYEGRGIIRAAQDSLILESFRIRSGGVGDTIGIRGALHFERDQPIMMAVALSAKNAILARQRDGTDLVVSSALDVRGPLLKPAVSGVITVPRATLIIDPLGASTALDLSTDLARGYLSASELPTLAGNGRTMARLGQFATVANLRVELGDAVWVRTPEANVKLSGQVALATQGDAIVPEGEISANRGQYRLDLGVVQRGFSIDSGRVRFFGDPALAPSLDITATNVVRLATGDDIPVGVHIGGTIERPQVTLSSTDPLYSSAPESEIISLLIFGAPTFALDGQSQSTVRAVTGVLLPSVGGKVEGALQKLLPVFNTVQVSTAGGQTGEDRQTVSTLLDNLSLSISAGKQLGSRTFLRLNTGVCRGTGQSAARGASLWYGVAVEYRLTHGFSGQIGVDPGSAPCSRLGVEWLPRMQFGFDFFRDWVF